MAFPASSLRRTSSSAARSGWPTVAWARAPAAATASGSGGPLRSSNERAPSAPPPPTLLLTLGGGGRGKPVPISDAEASRIVVTTAGGGQSLIRIEDDGLGMDEADLVLSVERHATSKLNADDLDDIRTLGCNL